MPLLRKDQLLARFEESLRHGSAQFDRIGDADAHPAYYRLYQPVQTTLRVYTWNITHGGGDRRPSDEYRIQVTGVENLEEDTGHVTLVLGWWDQAAVFAGWDIRRHAGSVAYSPSMQVKEQTLVEASVRGLSLCHRGGGETTVAFRPEMALAYIEHLRGLHDQGGDDWAEEVNESVRQAADTEERLSLPAEPVSVRERTRVQLTRAVRDSSFRRRVLGAYEHTCAVCGLQMDLVEAAHIIPVSHDLSSDETTNGLCLCALHHKAFDVGLLLVDETYRVDLHNASLERLRALRRISGLESFRENLRAVIQVPSEPILRPKPTYLAVRRQMAG